MSILVFSTLSRPQAIPPICFYLLFLDVGGLHLRAEMITFIIMVLIAMKMMIMIKAAAR